MTRVGINPPGAPFLCRLPPAGDGGMQQSVELLGSCSVRPCMWQPAAQLRRASLLPRVRGRVRAAFADQRTASPTSACGGDAAATCPAASCADLEGAEG